VSLGGGAARRSITLSLEGVHQLSSLWGGEGRGKKREDTQQPQKVLPLEGGTRVTTLQAHFAQKGKGKVPAKRSPSPTLWKKGPSPASELLAKKEGRKDQAYPTREDLSYHFFGKDAVLLLGRRNRKIGKWLRGE